MRRVASMSWERRNWIELQQAGERVSDIAARCQVSRRTVHKWIARYEEFGEPGLEEWSRAPHEHPRAVDALWRERVRGARQTHPHWGAKKLEWLLKKHYGEAPSPSTIGRILLESGLTRARRRVGKAEGTGSLQGADRPNELWTIDFKGWRRTSDGERLEPLTICDHATRYLLCCQHLDSTRSERVRPVMERVFREYGLPERIRSDNGAPFASTGLSGLTELSAWWIELGIAWERIEPGRPQQNGRHERMHRSLEEALMEPPATTLRQQQRRLEDFRRDYNEQRPHEGLGQRTPAELYRRGEREFGRVNPLEYPSDWEVRAVNSGEARWRCGRVFVSHALNGKRVGFEPWQGPLWRVWFHRHWIGVWDEGNGRWYSPAAWTKKMLKAHQQDGSSPPEPPVV